MHCFAGFPDDNDGDSNDDDEDDDNDNVDSQDDADDDTGHGSMGPMKNRMMMMIKMMARDMVVWGR